MKTLAAIIPAAGLSSRMGEFKPLLALGQGTVLSRCIELFRTNGVEQILVVTGNQSTKMAEATKQACAIPVYNENYEKGMFSSVVTGINALNKNISGFFMLPVDIPLVRHETIARLIYEFDKKKPAILYPRFNGKRGHPPIIAKKLIPEIIKYDGSGGLRALLDKYESESCDLDVADFGSIHDLDHPEDYSFAKSRIEIDYPSKEECEQLWNMYDLPYGIRNHCSAVARVGTAICNKLNEDRLSGQQLDCALVEGASLTHDIGKGTKQHEIIGAKILIDHGFNAAAQIVRDHFDLVLETTAPITEKEIVFLADKLVQRDMPVSLETRYESALKRFGHEPKVRQAILGRHGRAKSLLNRFEQETNISMKKLAKKALK